MGPSAQPPTFFFKVLNADSFSIIVPTILEADTDEEEILLGKEQLRKDLHQEIALYAGKLDTPGDYVNLLPEVDAKRQSKPIL